MFSKPFSKPHLKQVELIDEIESRKYIVLLFPNFYPIYAKNKLLRLILNNKKNKKKKLKKKRTIFTSAKI